MVMGGMLFALKRYINTCVCYFVKYITLYLIHAINTYTPPSMPDNMARNDSKAIGNLVELGI